jgi:bifunctional DNA-binding transcriptional regulator/antitoxin component of YhaV-PrlF toxin-antitoxin module
MARAKPTGPSAPVTERILVGNLGCIRFPLAIRQASGIKRGDRLAVRLEGRRTIVLAKVPDGMAAATLEVDECACQKRPEGCRDVADPVTVGWSYVQFDSDRAKTFGLLPSRPLKLVAEPFRISVSVERGLTAAELDRIKPVRCPP